MTVKCDSWPIMVKISESTITSSKITDASAYQEFKILNFLKLDIYKKYKNLTVVYNLIYKIHIADYQSLSYSFDTELSDIYKDHHVKCDCIACFIIVPIPKYRHVDVELVNEKCLIKNYTQYSLLDPKGGKETGKRKRRKC